MLGSKCVSPAQSRTAAGEVQGEDHASINRTHHAMMSCSSSVHSYARRDAYLDISNTLRTLGIFPSDSHMSIVMSHSAKTGPPLFSHVVSSTPATSPPFAFTALNRALRLIAAVGRRS